MKIVTTGFPLIKIVWQIFRFNLKFLSLTLGGFLNVQHFKIKKKKSRNCQLKKSFTLKCYFNPLPF